MPILSLSAVLSFFVDVFLVGFCRQALLPLVFVLVVLLLLGKIGVGYGLRRLVWHKHFAKQVTVGLVLGVLLVKILFVGLLLESDRLPVAGQLHEHTYRQWLREYAPGAEPIAVYCVGVVLCGLLPALVCYGVLWAVSGLIDARALRRCDPQPQPPHVPREAALAYPKPWGLLLGVTGALLLFAALVASLYQLAPARTAFTNTGALAVWSMEQFPHHYVDKRPYRAANATLPPGVNVLAPHGVAAVSTGVALLFYVVIVPLFWRSFSPVVALGFLLNLLVGAYGFLAFYLPASLPFVACTVLLLLTIGGVSRYKMRFPTLDYTRLRPLDRYPAPTNEANAPPEDTGAVAVRYGPLIDSTRISAAGKTDKAPLAIACASGGGLRAAVWTAALLEQLETHFGQQGVAFPYHLRLLTGASGGMVGAAYYAATLQAPDPGAPGSVCRDPRHPLADLKYNLAKDSLSRLAYKLTYADLWAIGLPRCLWEDRGAALEQSWADNLHGALQESFAQLRAGERAGWRPSLILSPMLIEDGWRLLVSNLDLWAIVANRGNRAHDTDGLFSLAALEFYRLFPEAEAFQLSTAVRMSASFPYFSPAATLPTWPRRRVVDAGYFDNYGVSLASSWIFHYRDWLLKNTGGVALIQIRDGLSYRQRTRPEGAGRDDTGLVGRGLEWLTAPLAGALTAREWTCSFRNDEQLRTLTELFDTAEDMFFNTFTFEYGGDASLNWSLADVEVQSLVAEAEHCGQAEEMKQLLNWWTGRSGAVPSGNY